MSDTKVLHWIHLWPNLSWAPLTLNISVLGGVCDSCCSPETQNLFFFATTWELIWAGTFAGTCLHWFFFSRGSCKVPVPLSRASKHFLGNKPKQPTVILYQSLAAGWENKDRRRSERSQHGAKQWRKSSPCLQKPDGKRCRQDERSRQLRPEHLRVRTHDPARLWHGKTLLSNSCCSSGGVVKRWLPCGRQSLFFCLRHNLRDSQGAVQSCVRVSGTGHGVQWLHRHGCCSPPVRSEWPHSRRVFVRSWRRASELSRRPGCCQRLQVLRRAAAARTQAAAADGNV